MTKSTPESSDEYADKIVQSARYRVIKCRDGIQWVVQCNYRGRWRSESYLTTKSALLREWVKRFPHITSIPPELEELPDRI